MQQILDKMWSQSFPLVSLVFALLGRAAPVAEPDTIEIVIVGRELTADMVAAALNPGPVDLANVGWTIEGNNYGWTVDGNNYYWVGNGGHTARALPDGAAVPTAAV
ncbi:hypothetical protein R3P38DRAFT_3535855 [Favolaschia claudopus]|uniref:Lamin tail domain-containing protein n=1 Tax=Favolaschia claudopus TaxID=2862362 RepID=A0AAW0BDD5_9AGAR